MEMTKTLFDLLVENGGDDQAIADMLSENLNTAISQYREKEQIQKKKRDAEALADHFNTFVEIYYPDCPKNTISGQDIVEIWDSVQKIINGTGNFEEILDLILGLKSENDSKRKKTLADYIAEMKW